LIKFVIGAMVHGFILKTINLNFRKSRYSINSNIIDFRQVSIYFKIIICVVTLKPSSLRLVISLTKLWSDQIQRFELFVDGRSLTITIVHRRRVIRLKSFIALLQVQISILLDSSYLNERINLLFRRGEPSR